MASPDADGDLLPPLLQLINTQNKTVVEIMKIAFFIDLFLLPNVEVLFGLSNIEFSSSNRFQKVS